MPDYGGISPHRDPPHECGSLRLVALCLDPENHTPATRTRPHPPGKRGPPKETGGALPGQVPEGAAGPGEARPAQGDRGPAGQRVQPGRGPVGGARVGGRHIGGRPALGAGVERQQAFRQARGVEPLGGAGGAVARLSGVVRIVLGLGILAETAAAIV